MTLTRRSFLTGAGALALTPILTGNASAEAPLAPPIKPFRGSVAWLNPTGYSPEDLADIAAAPWVGGLSARLRLQDVTTDTSSFDFSQFRKVQTAARNAGKKYALMLLHGVEGAGTPTAFFNGVPENETITLQDARALTWWSKLGQTRTNATHRALATAFNSDPAHFAVKRVTMSWGDVNAEPWFGGHDHRDTWIKQWRDFRNFDPSVDGDVVYRDLQRAYQGAEQAAFHTASTQFVSSVNLAMASGDAFEDVDDSYGRGDPLRHPARLATWAQVRHDLPYRAVFQQNGADWAEGASGYSAWLAASFGPQGKYPGWSGGQAIRGVTEGKKVITVDQFRKMLDNETARGVSYVEVYGGDVLAAVRSTTYVGRQLRAILIDHASKYTGAGL